MSEKKLSFTWKHIAFDEARAAVVEALKTEGFGLLTEADIRQTLKTKIDVDFKPYTILGACNPKLAHEALQRELKVGLMMPCNVILYEDDAGAVHVEAIDASMAAEGLGNPALDDFAAAVTDKLAAVIATLAE